VNSTSGSQAQRSSGGGSDALQALLEKTFAPVVARTLLMVARRRANCPEGEISGGVLATVVREIEGSLPAYLADPERRRACLSALRAFLGERSTSGTSPIVARLVPINSDADMRLVTEAARSCARDAGMSVLDQTKTMTVCAELARNILQYAGSGELRLWLVDRPRRGIGIEAVDRGPGIADLARVLSPSYVSRTGMGIGLQGSRRLVDEFDIESAPGKGTSVTLRKYA